MESRNRFIFRGIHAVLAMPFSAIVTRVVTLLTVALTLVGLRKGTGHGPQGVTFMAAVGVMTAGVFVVAGILVVL